MMLGPEYNSAGAGATPQRRCFAPITGAGRYPLWTGRRWTVYHEASHG